LVARRRRRIGWLAALLIIALGLALTPTVEAVLFNYKLSGSMVNGGDVTLFGLSPDGSYTVFVADARVNAIPELFSAPTAGDARLALSPALPAGSAVLGFAISPDSQKVVYWTGLTSDSKATQIYVVPINGSSAASLLVTAAAGEWLTDVAVSPNNLRIVYLVNSIPPTGSQQILATVLLAGGAPVQLSSGCGLGCSVEFQITPAGTEVVFGFYPGGAPDQLSRVNMAGVAELLDIDVREFAITPDGDYVVYEKSYTGLLDNLYSIPIGGGTGTKLSGTMVLNGSVLDFKIAPNSQAVVYRADELVDERVELFSVPVNGSAPRVCLTTGIIANGDVFDDYQITPNSVGVVYRADQLTDEKVELGGITLDGLHGYLLSGVMIANGDVSAFAITPNNLGVVFIADKLTDGRQELFAASIDGSAIVGLNSSLPAGGNVLDFLIAPNSAGVVYRADQVTDEYFNLYTTPITVSAPVRLNNALPIGGDVADSYLITPDSKGVVYRADQDTDGVDELFSTFDRFVRYLPIVNKS
jgi:hypothetical protein